MPKYFLDTNILLNAIIIAIKKLTMRRFENKKEEEINIEIDRLRKKNPRVVKAYQIIKAIRGNKKIQDMDFYISFFSLAEMHSAYLDWLLGYLLRL